MKSILKFFAVALVLILAEWAFDLGPSRFEESSLAIAPFLTTLIPGILSLAGGVAGTVQANKQAGKVDEQLNARQRKLDAWRDTELGSNYLDRADSREMLRRIAQHNQDQMKALNTNAIKGGASNEAKVAAATQLTRNYADAIGSIASAGQRHRDIVQQEYREQTNAIDNLKLKQLMENNTAQALEKGFTGAGDIIGKILSTAGGVATA